MTRMDTNSWSVRQHAQKLNFVRFQKVEFNFVKKKNLIAYKYILMKYNIYILLYFISMSQ